MAKKVREKKLLKLELILIALEIILGIFGNFIYQRNMAEGARIIISKYNFISQMTWGNGNFFPVLYLISLLILLILIISSYIRESYEEDRLSSNILVVAGLLFLIIPSLIKIIKINPGLITMVVIQIIILFINIARTKE